MGSVPASWPPSRRARFDLLSGPTTNAVTQLRVAHRIDVQRQAGQTEGAPNRHRPYTVWEPKGGIVPVSAAGRIVLRRIGSQTIFRAEQPVPEFGHVAGTLVGFDDEPWTVDLDDTNPWSDNLLRDMTGAAIGPA